MKRDKILITTGLTPFSSSLFFQNDTLLTFLTVQESLTYTALLTLKKCSNSSIKKKVCILESSTRKSYKMSHNVFISSTFHPWLCFTFERFCNPHSADGEKSPCWGVEHKLPGGPTSPGGLCWCPRTSPLYWDKTPTPSWSSYHCRRCWSCYWGQFPFPRGSLSSLGYLGPCVLASLMDSTADFGTTLSPVGCLSLTSTDQKNTGLLSLLASSYFLDEISVFQIYLKGSFWILLKVKLDIPDQKVLISVFSLPQSSTQYFILPQNWCVSRSLILEVRAAHYAPYLNF